MFRHRNLGYFEIPREAFEHLDVIQEIMAQVVILKAEFHFDTMSISYFAIGPFDNVEEHCEAPHYNIVCYEGLEGKPFSFVKGDKMEGTNWLKIKLYDCLKCFDEGTLTCRTCSGSGEGMADGSKCLECGGSGEIPCGCAALRQ